MGGKHLGLFNAFQRSLTPDNNHKKSHVFVFVYVTLICGEGRCREEKSATQKHKQ